MLPYFSLSASENTKSSQFTLFCSHEALMPTCPTMKLVKGMRTESISPRLKFLINPMPSLSVFRMRPTPPEPGRLRSPRSALK